MSLLANTGVLLGKELKTEFRSRELSQRLLYRIWGIYRITGRLRGKNL